MTLVVIIIIAAALFLLAFMTKRRFGVLGLGLAAGVLLADQLTKGLAEIIERHQLPVAPLSYVTAANVLLILAPALILLLAGPTYANKRDSIVGSIIFALLATVLLLDPLTTALPILDVGVKPVIDFIAANKWIIVSVGLTLAIGDTLLVHTSGGHKKKRSKD